MAQSRGQVWGAMGAPSFPGACPILGCLPCPAVMCGTLTPRMASASLGSGAASLIYKNSLLAPSVPLAGLQKLAKTAASCC